MGQFLGNIGVNVFLQRKVDEYWSFLRLKHEMTYMYTACLKIGNIYLRLQYGEFKNLDAISNLSCVIF